jgi:hypothetical protein
MNKTKQYEKDCTERNKRTFNFYASFYIQELLKKVVAALVWLHITNISFHHTNTHTNNHLISVLQIKTQNNERFLSFCS